MSHSEISLYNFCYYLVNNFENITSCSKVMLTMKYNEPNEQFSPSFKNNCSVLFIEW